MVCLDLDLFSPFQLTNLITTVAEELSGIREIRSRVELGQVRLCLSRAVSRACCNISQLVRHHVIEQLKQVTGQVWLDWGKAVQIRCGIWSVTLFNHFLSYLGDIRTFVPFMCHITGRVSIFVRFATGRVKNGCMLYCNILQNSY